jgi:ribosomal protein S18 acetylase RimI-like enzyme
LSLVEVSDVPPGRRDALKGILEDSFEGWYLRHSLGTLESIEAVKAATLGGQFAGLAMLKMLDSESGYVFYIAVSKQERRKGVGGRLLDESLAYLGGRGATRVFASVEEDNAESKALFRSRGFDHTDFGEMSNLYGFAGALNKYRVMRVVPGEELLMRVLTPQTLPSTESRRPPV